VPLGIVTVAAIGLAAASAGLLATRTSKITRPHHAPADAFATAPEH
jgi:hypothetical protein